MQPCTLREWTSGVKSASFTGSCALRDEDRLRACVCSRQTIATTEAASRHGNASIESVLTPGYRGRCLPAAHRPAMRVGLRGGRRGPDAPRGMPLDPGWFPSFPYRVLSLRTGCATIAAARVGQRAGGREAGQIGQSDPVRLPPGFPRLLGACWETRLTVMMGRRNRLLPR